LGDPRAILSHPSPDRIGIISIYIRFLKQGKVGNKAISRSNVVKTIQDFRVRAWFLIFKLSTWKAKNFEFAAVIKLGEGVVGGVLNWSISSEACNICKQYHFSFVLREIVGNSFEIGERKGIKRGLECSRRVISRNARDTGGNFRG